jgi:hypothetical protein
MNMDKLNRWLTLIANFGVLIGIIVVAVELRQTQTAMEGEASTMRAQMAIDIQSYITDARLYEFASKLDNGEDLTPEERARVNMFLVPALRHFENLHYQWQIGILSDEIWESNVQGLGNLCQGSLFQAAYPTRWGVGFRESFVELVTAPCK